MPGGESAEGTEKWTAGRSTLQGGSDLARTKVGEEKIMKGVVGVVEVA